MAKKLPISSDSQSDPKPYTKEDFVEEYQKFCYRTGFELVTTPVWLPRDDGTFSMKIQLSVREIPKPIQG